MVRAMGFRFLVVFCSPGRTIWILIGLVLVVGIGLAGGSAGFAQISDEAAYRDCISTNERYMGVEGADAFCRQQVELTRQQRTPGNRAEPLDEERAYRLCVLEAKRRLGGDMIAESYCNQQREYERSRQQLLRPR